VDRQNQQPDSESIRHLQNAFEQFNRLSASLCTSVDDLNQTANHLTRPISPGDFSSHSMIYLMVQPVRKQLAARRATAGLAVANSREHNNADDCFLTGPEGAPQIGQCRVAVLVKGKPFPADSALPWPIWDALHPKIYH